MNKETILLKMETSLSPKRVKLENKSDSANLNEDGPQIMVIGDVHVSNTKLEIMGRLRARLSNLLKSYDENGQNVDEIVFLGDLLDSFKLQSLNFVINWIVEISKIVPVTVLVGNHERMSNNDYCSDNHYYTGLQGRRNITVVWQPIIRTIKNKKFLFMPFVPAGRFLEAIAEFCNGLDSLNEISAVYAHVGLNNISDHLPNSGNDTRMDQWPIHYPVIISGHWHLYKLLAPNILYVSPPVQVNRGEPNKNYIIVCRFSSSRVRSILQTRVKEVNYASLEAIHPLAHEWQHFVVRVNLPYIKEYNVNAANFSEFQLKTDDRISRHHLTLTGSSADVDSVRKSRDFRELVLRSDVTYNFDKTDLVTLSDLKCMERPKSDANFLDQLEKRIDQKNNPNLMNLFREIFRS